jgi:hypothetical protein
MMNLRRCKMKKSVAIYLPNGDVDSYEQGNDIERINLLNHNMVGVVYKDGTDLVFSGMPFIFRHEPETKVENEYR